MLNFPFQLESSKSGRMPKRAIPSTYPKLETIDRTLNHKRICLGFSRYWQKLRLDETLNDYKAYVAKHDSLWLEEDNHLQKKL